MGSKQQALVVSFEERRVSREVPPESALGLFLANIFLGDGNEH